MTQPVPCSAYADVTVPFTVIYGVDHILNICIKIPYVVTLLCIVFNSRSLLIYCEFFHAICCGYCLGIFCCSRPIIS